MKLEMPEPRKSMHPVIVTALIAAMLLAAALIGTAFAPSRDPLVGIVTPTTRIHPADAERRLRQLAEEKANPFGQGARR